MKAFFENFSSELTGQLRSHGRLRSFGDGEEIFAEGDRAESLPIVVKGSVKMIHFLEPGKEVIIGIFGTGEMFALPPVFDGGNYPATALAMEDSDLLLVGRQDFLNILRTSNEFSFAVIEWMSGMLREKTATIQNLATASPDHRVAHILIKLAEKETDGPPIKIRLRRQDIAKMAGLTTETTIRAIRRLSTKGLIRIEHGKVVIENEGLLQQFLES